MELKLESGEWWWGGRVIDASAMPCGAGAPGAFTLAPAEESNQAQPLLISSAGRFLWSERPFDFSVGSDALRVTRAEAAVEIGRGGASLAEAFRTVARKHFPASGTMPVAELFAQPQYNTWIELLYDQREEQILQYAQAIVDRGYPPGVLMIDDNWQEDYGTWEFSTRRFRDPRRLVERLHALGFQVMLWICPFVSPDSEVYRALRQDGLLLSETVVGSQSTPEPAAVRWWNGVSAVLDLTHPEACAWFRAQLDRLRRDYGIDGFKFDAGDTGFYLPTPGREFHPHRPCTPEDHTAAFAAIGLEYPFNEYRACWKLAGQPLAQRLRDKEHTWTALRDLIPGILAQGLMGYAFTCPDLIGGGHAGSFADAAKFDPELVVRSAQVHALMPMMQFSVAPWRVLSPELNAICREAARLHSRQGARLLALAKHSAATGEPMVRPLAWQWPGMGYERVRDQFMLGDDLLVAPVMVAGARDREIVFPPGKWQGDDGTTVEGPTRLFVHASLARLPHYSRVA